jgi:hypothetical protein
MTSRSLYLLLSLVLVAGCESESQMLNSEQGPRKPRSVPAD